MINLIIRGDKIEKEEFYRQFKIALRNKKDYRSILTDLENRIFPFHKRNQYDGCKRYYYWHKQNYVHKFTNLNNKLINIVKGKIEINK